MKNLMSMLGTLSALAAMDTDKLREIIESYRPEYENIQKQEKLLANKIMKEIQEYAETHRNDPKPEEPEDEAREKLIFTGKKTGVELWEDMSDPDSQLIIRKGTPSDLAREISNLLADKNDEVAKDARILHKKIMARGLDED